VSAEGRPLAGRTIVLTRAPEQVAAMVRRLEVLGARVVLLPTVEFRAPEDCGPLDDAIREVAGFDWICFTSQNAVRFFFDRCRLLNAGTDALPRLAAVGPATASVLESVGGRADYVAVEYRGEALAAELAGEVKQKRVLLPHSNRASEALPAALRAAGAEVVEVVAYETRRPEAGAGEPAAIVASADAIAFASPSAFRHLLEMLGEDAVRRLAPRVAFAAIGPVTAAAIREAGFTVAVQAAESTGEGLVNALVERFAVAPPAGRIKR
jgi:uroporphyrinogen-III synthase